MESCNALIDILLVKINKTNELLKEIEKAKFDITNPLAHYLDGRLFAGEMGDYAIIEADYAVGSDYHSCMTR
jgi:hypothetical protein